MGRRWLQGVTPGAAQLYALAPNNAGFAGGIGDLRFGGLCVFIAATEGFSRANTNISLAGAVERVQDVMRHSGPRRRRGAAARLYFLRHRMPL